MGFGWGFDPGLGSGLVFFDNWILREVILFNAWNAMDDRDKEGKFLPDHKKTKGCGAPLSGRSQAMAILDKICAESETAILFETTLRTRLAADPLEFYREFVVALAPKQLNIADISKSPEITPGYFKDMLDAVPSKPDG